MFNAALKRVISIIFTLSALNATEGTASDRVIAPQNGAEIYHEIQKLNTLGRALYVAAHPDDENTSLISYLSLGRQYDTAYLSLTRGDGGQNLIGPELREKLGVIRTQELLEARRIDGGQQFFSRANDFGFSKHPDETFRIWGREGVLSDMVWVIRSFQPDVIITRFNLDPGYTHGHHTASAILAVEAFDAAADPERFPEQLEWVAPWQAKRVVWNTSSWFFRNSGAEFNENDYIRLEVGEYDSLLGKSYNEIASASRSMHRSQGFGTRLDRGSRVEYFKLLAGEPIEGDLFDNVDTTWSRVPNGEMIEAKVDSLLASYSVQDPALSIPQLLELREALANGESTPWLRRKREAVEQIILSCAGLHLMAASSESYVSQGQSFEVAIEAINRSSTSVRIQNVEFPFADKDFLVDRPLLENQEVRLPFSVVVPENSPLPQPYWLQEEGTLGMFEVRDQNLRGKAENDPAFYASISLQINDAQLTVRTPLFFREVDPAKGESLKPVLQLPAASVAFVSDVSLFPNYEPREVKLVVDAVLQAVGGTLELELPKGWKSSPASVETGLIPQGGKREFTFVVSPAERSEKTKIRARLTSGETVFRDSVTRINYEHIREQTIFANAQVEAVSLSVEYAGSRIGYLAGAGDSVADSLREIGYEVIDLNPVAMQASDLQGLDSVVVGIRAYNTVDEIENVMKELYRFAEKGGTVVVQYNTSHRLKLGNIAPYDLTLSRDRVTDEFAEVRVLAPDHPVLNVPNRITQQDFNGWVQERGLYFPSSWGSEFTPILSVNDPGETAKEGSLLVAPVGEGYFIYTGLSWFRQLPAGVPGAYRIFANLVSLGHEPEKK